jgi:hypothetical protein
VACSTLEGQFNITVFFIPGKDENETEDDKEEKEVIDLTADSPKSSDDASQPVEQNAPPQQDQDTPIDTETGGTGVLGADPPARGHARGDSDGSDKTIRPPPSPDHTRDPTAGATIERFDPSSSSAWTPVDAPGAGRPVKKFPPNGNEPYLIISLHVDRYSPKGETHTLMFEFQVSGSEEATRGFFYPVTVAISPCSSLHCWYHWSTKYVSPKIFLQVFTQIKKPRRTFSSASRNHSKRDVELLYFSLQKFYG